MTLNRSFVLLLVMVVVSMMVMMINGQPSSSKQASDIIFSITHMDDSKPRCTVTFKPRLLSANDPLISTNQTNKALTTTCTLLNTKQKQDYQSKALEYFTTTISSDLQYIDNIPIKSSLPKDSLSKSNQYEQLTLHLDATSLNLIGASYKLVSTPLGDNQNQLYAQVDLSTFSQRAAIEPPPTEKEKEEKEQSFFGKYYLYIIPLVLVMVLNVVLPQPESGGEGQQRSGGGQAAPKRK